MTLNKVYELSTIPKFRFDVPAFCQALVFLRAELILKLVAECCRMNLHTTISASVAILLFTINFGTQSLALSFCSSEIFTFPPLFGAEVSTIEANDTFQYETSAHAPGSDRERDLSINFCNVTVTYTHPGWNDAIHVRIWLPHESSWNGRLQAVGGGGYSASIGPFYMAHAVAEGYAAVDTDAGHEAGIEFAQSMRTWALASPGNVNLYLLEDFGSRSLHEMAVIGRKMTAEFYGRDPSYSFFNGCSQGGRQGMTLAQRYPDDFNGILAVAPAINADKFVPAACWPYHVMTNLSAYPPTCEIEAFTQAAIEHCDHLDGVTDGLISKPSLCNFQASSMVGKTYLCNGTERNFTVAGAKIVQAAWDGPRSPSGRAGWFGLGKDASLTKVQIKTECVFQNNTCSAIPSELLSSWIIHLVAKDPNFSMAEMTTEQFYTFLAQSEREYHDMLAAADPDLSSFRAAGGKLITWHGLADEIIPPEGTTAYYQQVLELDPTAGSFYRVFEAPGVAHCFGGAGFVPHSAFDQLVAWVENGTVPDTLTATNMDGHLRELCPYPKEQSYIGGDPEQRGSFKCVDPGAMQRGRGSDEKLAQVPFVQQY